MKLSPIQNKIVLHDDSAIVKSCPGSGKTRTLIAKLIRCINEVRGTSRKICCLTYTNAATYEIEERVRIWGKSDDEEYCDISTIHSFCISNILRHFHNRIPSYVNGFKVTTPDDEVFKAEAINALTKFGWQNEFKDEFENLGRDPNGSPRSHGDIPPEIIFEFWSRLERKGLIDFPNIIYHSLKILESNPSLSRSLGSKFAWFLIDEYQDTTTTQVEIFRHISSSKFTKFFFVGDPHQSIFAFAGAKTEETHKLADEIGCNGGFSLFENYRSSQLISNHANSIFVRNPPMRSTGVNAALEQTPDHFHRSQVADAIHDLFLPKVRELGISYGETAIIAPWWVKLYKLGRNLRNLDIPIVGPGSRPYKKSHLIVPMIEQVGHYIAEKNPGSLHHIKRELYYLLLNLGTSNPRDAFGYEGSVAVIKIVRGIQEIVRHNYPDWLARSAEEIFKVLLEYEWVSSEVKLKLAGSALSLVQDFKKHQPSGVLSIEEFGLHANPKNHIHLMTIHKSKGREFDAVAIVDIHEGRIPNFRVKNDPSRIEEEKRSLYVSITRARKYLAYITDEEDRLVPSRFLGQQFLGIRN